jgi:mannitol/fructose-specific phosphotransferase system IIA component (Ntr-type)
VRLVFLIAVPATDSTPYLPLISGLARLAKDRQFVEKLHPANVAFQMLAALQRIKLQTGQANDILKKLRTK